MPRLFLLRDESIVNAPLERCFRLSASVEIVKCEPRMEALRGRTSGLVRAGDTVLWKGRKYGLPQFHESQIDRRAPSRRRSQFSVVHHFHA